jgi:hypothetical protein
MDGREAVRKAISFRSPDRIPCAFWRWGPNDLEALEFPVLTVRLDGTHERDEFGGISEKPDGRAIGYEVEHPLAGPARFPACPWPDPDDPRRFAGLRGKAERIREQGRAVTCNCLAML